ncbi:hypothetical protein E143388_08383 [Rhodococcus opacus]|nr:hypothetical protein E143388_08383 [Rhodococcus opacus]
MPRPTRWRRAVMVMSTLVVVGALGFFGFLSVSGPPLGGAAPHSVATDVVRQQPVAPWPTMPQLPLPGLGESLDPAPYPAADHQQPICVPEGVKCSDPGILDIPIEPEGCLPNCGPGILETPIEPEGCLPNCGPGILETPIEPEGCLPNCGPGILETPIEPEGCLPNCGPGILETPIEPEGCLPNCGPGILETPIEPEGCLPNCGPGILETPIEPEGCLPNCGPGILETPIEPEGCPPNCPDPRIPPETVCSDSALCPPAREIPASPSPGQGPATPVPGSVVPIPGIPATVIPGVVVPGAAQPLPVQQALELSDPAVAPGAPVTASGSGCPPGAGVALSVEGVRAGETQADAGGSFEAPVSPVVADVGRHQVSAECGPVLTAPLDIVLVSQATGSTATSVVIVFFLLIGLLIYRRRLLTPQSYREEPQSDLEQPQSDLGERS